MNAWTPEHTARVLENLEHSGYYPTKKYLIEALEDIQSLHSGEADSLNWDADRIDYMRGFLANKVFYKNKETLLSALDAIEELKSENLADVA